MLQTGQAAGLSQQGRWSEPPIAVSVEMDFVDMGPGICQTMNGQTPSFEERRAMKPRECELECAGTPTCNGYSLRGISCLLFFEGPLRATGGAHAGNDRCHARAGQGWREERPQSEDRSAEVLEADKSAKVLSESTVDEPKEGRQSESDDIYDSKEEEKSPRQLRAEAKELREAAKRLRESTEESESKTATGLHQKSGEVEEDDDFEVKEEHEVGKVKRQAERSSAGAEALEEKLQAAEAAMSKVTKATRELRSKLDDSRDALHKAKTDSEEYRKAVDKMQEKFDQSLAQA